MGRKYSRKPDPKLSDLPLIWDSENSDWRLTTLQAIKSLFSTLFGSTVKTTLADADLFAIKDSAITTDDNDASVSFATLVDEIQDEPFEEGIKLTEGRVTDNEFTSSAAIATPGWYTIAISAAVAGQETSAKFMMTDIGGGGLGVEIAVCESTVVKSFSNTTVKLFSPHSNLLSTPVNQVESFRLAKSNTVNGSGFKVQAYLNPSSARLFHSKIMDNFSKDGSSGFTLIEPILENSPILPDGVTAATFLEAGSEYRTRPNGASNSPNVSFVKLSDDAIGLNIDWNQIAKRGSSLSLSYLSLQLAEYTSSLITYTFDGTEIIGTPEYQGEEVFVIITKVAAFTNFTNAGKTVRANTLVVTLA